MQRDIVVSNKIQVFEMTHSKSVEAEEDPERIRGILKQANCNTFLAVDNFKTNSHYQSPKFLKENCFRKSEVEILS